MDTSKFRSGGMIFSSIGMSQQGSVPSKMEWNVPKYSETSNLSPHELGRPCNFWRGPVGDYATAGEVVSDLVQFRTGRYTRERNMDVGIMADLYALELAQMIDERLFLDASATIVVGNYTPRGRKRRDAPVGQRRLLRLRLDAETVYYCTGVIYRGGELLVTRDRVTTRCLCRLQGRVGRTFALWEHSPLRPDEG